ncbi:MAG: hypothetical protein ACKO7P_16325, partial [Bacteroidota bacterium]
MSYQREYKARIKVAYSGSVNYPSSTNGGTKSYSGETYEDVIVKIDVDDSSFNNSIRDCNNNVKLLTGSVVAAESAQIVSINNNNSKIVASIDLNSQKVAGTIVNGFYKLIRSEISQQIAELTQGIDSQLMHLRELSKAVVDKKRQMEGDFLRISSRYTKTFDDLNNELSNRIFELDKPTFVFKKELDNQSIRTTNNDLVNTVAIFGKEGSELQSKISASIAKKRALDTLNKAKVFLWQQKKLNNTVQQSMLNESTASLQFSPVCFMETKADKNQITKGIHAPSFVSALHENQ